MEMGNLFVKKKSTASQQVECNIVLAGVGGQGVVLASNVIMQFFIECRLVVKKSEIHGMAQRGGSVLAHVRAGNKIFSPVIEFGKADFLIVIDRQEGHFQKDMLRKNIGMVIELNEVEEKRLIHVKKKNIALLAKFFFQLINNDSFHKLVLPSNNIKQRINTALEKIILKEQLEINKRVFEDYFV